MDSAEYKLFHEDYMRNHTGSAVWESGVVLTSIPLGTFLVLYVTPLIPKKVVPFLEFLVIVFPVILGVTYLSDKVYLIPFTMLMISLGILFFDFNFKSFKQVLNKDIKTKKSYISNYRASTNFVSVLCILAVDFIVFPRKFAKTESFGFGLMDLGVGFFVCANGIVVKNLKTSNEFKKVFKGALVLIVLGIGRIVSTKSVDYHQLVTEYGIHWNFFFTLAFCKLFAYVVIACTRSSNPFFLTLLTGIIHQLVLSAGMQEWVFSSVPRDSLISANREGITSLLGYVSLYFASVSLGQLLNSQKQNKSYKHLLIELSVWMVIGWICTSYFYNTVGVSRKLANIGYNIWVLSLSISKIIQFILAEIMVQMIYINSKYDFEKMSCVPELLECINRNGLFYFLLGNLLTGAINITFQTLLMGKRTSILLLTIYKAVLCLVAYILYRKNVVIKFW